MCSMCLVRAGQAMRASAGTPPAFAEMSVPVDREGWISGSRVARDEYDDVGGNGVLAPRGRVSGPDRMSSRCAAPGVRENSRPAMLVSATVRHCRTIPYVDCDPGSATSAAGRARRLNPRQVTRADDRQPARSILTNTRTGSPSAPSTGKWPEFVKASSCIVFPAPACQGQNSANWAMQNLNECMD